MASSDDATDLSFTSPTAMSEMSSPNYMRDTASSSARKGSLQSGSGNSAVHVCSYSYCSLNGHHHCHHAPLPPLKEFISAKRQLINNQKNKQLRINAVHSTSATDSPITICTKPRKKWAIDENQTSETDYDRELAEVSTKESLHTGRQEALNKDLHEPHDIFSICDVVATSDETVESLIGEEKTPSSGDDLIIILSDERKYTNIWTMICQQLASTDMPNTRSEGISVATEKKNVDVNTCHNEIGLDQEQSKCSKIFNKEEDNQEVTTENPEFDQTAAVKLVQEALIAILEHDQEMTDSHVTKLSGSTMQREVDPTEGEMPQKQMSKSYRNLRKIFVTAQVIKAMERMKNISPRPPQYLSEQPASEEEKICLKHISGNERKNTEEWMLDYALRQAISRLDPGQQRRVAQLVEAFETVTLANDEPEKIISIPDEQDSSEEKRLRDAPEDQTRATDSSLKSAGISCEPVDKEVDGGMTTVDKEVDDRFLQKTVQTAISESTMQWIQNSSMPIPAEVEYEVLSIGVDAEISCSIEDEQKVVENSIYNDLQEDYHMNILGVRTDLSSDVRHSDQTSLHIKHPVRPKGCSVENPLTVRKEEVKASVSETPRHAFISEYRQQDFQHNIDRSIFSDKQKVELQLSAEVDTQVNTDNFSPSSPEIIHDNDMDTPTRMSFGFHENEAIMLIQEAINELLLPEQENDNQSTSTRTSLEEAIYNQVLGNGRETSSPKVDNIATREDEKTSRRENLSTYSKLSKVIMCKRFIKEINKMRKLKLQSPQELSCTTHPEGEEAPSLRHTDAGEKKSWEEWMLDHVLQQVIEKLSQAQKKRVALLVQAFETVGSQPEPTTSASLKGEASIS